MERPIPQQIYRHFKGNLYQVLTIAIHSETKEELVIYQALYGDYKVYARPLSMFMSPVDRLKYPDVRQKMRFEPVDRELLSGNRSDNAVHTEVNSSFIVRPQPKTEAVINVQSTPQNKTMDIKASNSDYMNKTIEDEADELNLDPNVVAFLDSDSAKARIQILEKIRPIVTDDMIDIMAMAIDVEVEPGDVYDRLADLRNCLDTIARFETERLR